MSKALLVLPHDNFQDVEYLAPRRALIESGFQVVTASTTRLPICGAQGEVVHADCLLSQVDPASFVAVVFVGGYGTKSLWENPTAQKIARQAYEKGKVVAGICFGAVIPLKAGIGRHYRVTTYPEAREEVLSLGGNYQETSVVVDDRLITASGPEAAEEFALTLVKALPQK